MSRDHRDSGPVPERWLACPRKAKGPIAEKFIAFKTPLDERFNDKVEIKDRFTPNMFFQSAKALYKMRIGLWIDLTNTERYYDSDKIEDGYDDDGDPVKYMKLQCRGKGETPSEDQTKCFVNVCKLFISKNPLKLIAVHCTHGFNRTGFLIASYLIEVDDCNVSAALSVFSIARPPGIYKDDYIKELYRRYDDESSAPPAPLRPTWCLEFDDSETRKVGRKFPGGPSESEPVKKIKQTQARFMEGIPGVTPLDDFKEVKEVQKLAKKWTRFKGNEFPGCQPISMDLKNIKLLKEKEYMVSWKADGTRYMMMILGEDKVYFLDRENCVFTVKGLRFLHRKDPNTHLFNSLVDGEMVIDKHEGKDIPRYLIYDVLRVNDVDTTEFHFYPERVKTIEADIVNPRNKAIVQGRLDKSLEPFSVRVKTFLPVEKAGSFLSEKFSRQLTHEPDGLIFQPSIDPYTPGRCDDVLKWKPASLNSVDFKLKIQEEKGEGIIGKKIGYLFVGGKNEYFATMPCSKTLKFYDNKIIECKYENNKWVFMRERTDKSFPNSFNTAKAVCESILNPVTKEYLLDFIEHHRHSLYRDRDRMPPPKF